MSEERNLLCFFRFFLDFLKIEKIVYFIKRDRFTVFFGFEEKFLREKGVVFKFVCWGGFCSLGWWEGFCVFSVMGN